jgi:hypothetical protein
MECRALRFGSSGNLSETIWTCRLCRKRRAVVVVVAVVGVGVTARFILERVTKRVVVDPLGQGFRRTQTAAARNNE